MNTHKKIAMAGGGPGGLTLARLLQRKGIDVTVYERDAHIQVRVQGGALDLHTDSGLAALEKAGLMDEFKANYRPGADKVRIVDQHATILLDEHAPSDSGISHIQPPGSFGDQHHRPEIDRGPLRDLLLNSLKPDTVVWNSHITSIKKQNPGWQLVFQNGDTAFADILIGADGANSKIRPFVTDIRPQWQGVTMIEGSIKDAQSTAPEIHALLKGGKIFAYHNSQCLIVSSKGDGSFGFGVSWKTSESWYKDSGIDFRDNKQLLAWFKKEYAEWDSIWHQLFASDTTLFIPRPQYCMPLDQHWNAQPDLTLIGDAAHWMPPFAGEGVNMAMLDALELSESLTNPTFPDTQSAIAHYEKTMFKRFALKGQETLFNTRWMHEPNALQIRYPFSAVISTPTAPANSHQPPRSHPRMFRRLPPPSIEDVVPLPARSSKRIGFYLEN